MLKIAETEKRKSPWNLAAHTGWDSLRNLNPSLQSNQALSIQRSRSGAQILAGWVNEAKRLHKLARDTGREIHALALQRQLEAIADQIGRYC
jgi:hypothetical protein